MKTLYTTLIACGVLAFGSAVSAVTITIDGGDYDGEDVGSIDDRVAGIFLNQNAAGESDFLGNSGDGTETTWVNGAIEGDVVYTIISKTEDGEKVPYFNTVDDEGNDIDVFAFKLESTETDYFLVKNSTYAVLFENNSNFGWGVFSAEGELNFGSDYTISHVTAFSDGVATVPAPAAIWLLGSGLVGLIAAGRRKETTC